MVVGASDIVFSNHSALEDALRIPELIMSGLVAVLFKTAYELRKMWSHKTDGNVSVMIIKSS